MTLPTWLVCVGAFFAVVGFSVIGGCLIALIDILLHPKDL